MRAVVTHRSVLINAQRYSSIVNGHSERPGRPPWCVMVQGRGLILAASCQHPEDIQVLMVDPRAYGRMPKTGGGGASASHEPPYIDRVCKIQAPAIVTAICALPKDSAYDAAIATIEGNVYVISRDTQIDSVDELDAWSELCCVFNAHQSISTSPRIRALAPLAINNLQHRQGTNSPQIGSDRAELPPIAIMDDECVTLVDPGGKHKVLASNRTSRFTALASFRNTNSSSSARNASTTTSADGITWRLAVGDTMGRVTLRTSTDTHPNLRKVLQYGSVRHVYFAQNGTLLVCGDDGCVFVMYTDGSVRKLYEPDDAEGHSSVVTGVAMRGKRILSAGMDGRLVLWGDNALGEVIMEHSDEPFWALEWPEDNFAFVAACIEERGRSVLYRVRLNSRANTCTPPA